MHEGYVRLLDVQPALGAGLPRSERAEAHRLAVAPVLTLPAGDWSPARLRRAFSTRGAFAGILIDGLIVDDVQLDGRAATSLLGPGDLVVPVGRLSRSVQVTQRFGLVEATPVAMLDDTFAAIARRWPTIARALLAQGERQAQRLRLQEVIAHLPRADQRVVAFMWHLADRWGRVEPEGTVVPVVIGHEALSRLVGGRRSTISTAVGRLAQQGLVVRLANGTWLLDTASRALLDDSTPLPPTPSMHLRGRPPSSVGRLQAAKVS